MVLLGSDCVEVVVLGEVEVVLGSVPVGLRWCWVAFVVQWSLCCVVVVWVLWWCCVVVV